MKREFLKSERFWWWFTIVALVGLTQLVTCGLHAHVSAFQYVWIFGMSVLGFAKFADGISWIVSNARRL